ncbi:uncharacterized protein BDW47DRAFT_108529, partial [Aspergillus candidus]
MSATASGIDDASHLFHPSRSGIDVFPSRRIEISTFPSASSHILSGAVNFSWSSVERPEGDGRLFGACDVDRGIEQFAVVLVGLLRQFGVDLGYC